MEGSQAGDPRIADYARTDVPTCALHEPAESVRRRARAGGWEVTVVVHDSRVVLGLLQTQSEPRGGVPPVTPTAADVMYKEENGNKVLTGLAVAEPSASPPSGSRPPAGPPPATPRDSPKRY